MYWVTAFQVKEKPTISRYLQSCLDHIINIYEVLREYIYEKGNNDMSSYSKVCCNINNNFCAYLEQLIEIIYNHGIYKLSKLYVANSTNILHFVDER